MARVSSRCTSAIIIKDVGFGAEAFCESLYIPTCLACRIQDTDRQASEDLVVSATVWQNRGEQSHSNL